MDRDRDRERERIIYRYSEIERCRWRRVERRKGGNAQAVCISNPLLLLAIQKLQGFPRSASHLTHPLYVL